MKTSPPSPPRNAGTEIQRIHFFPFYVRFYVHVLLMPTPSAPFLIKGSRRVTKKRVAAGGRARGDVKTWESLYCRVCLTRKCL